MEDGDGPDAGDRTCTTSGPARLVRFDEAGLMQLQTEGLELLRGAKPPVRIVFAIGGSRCGMLWPSVQQAARLVASRRATRLIP